MKSTGRTKTLVEVSIQQTKCWGCALLENSLVEDVSTGKLIEGYRCPRNLKLPERLPPFFAEKCELYKPKG